MVRYDLNLFEVWKPIPGYEGMYDVSTEGRVWSHKTNRILKQSPNQKGYYRVKMEGKSMAVARLVCMTFNQNPDPEHLTEVNHINEDKRDNRFCNLEWCDRKYNVNYGTGTQRRLKKAYESGRQIQHMKDCQKKNVGDSISKTIKKRLRSTRRITI